MLGPQAAAAAAGVDGKISEAATAAAGPCLHAAEHDESAFNHLWSPTTFVVCYGLEAWQQSCLN